MDTEAMETEAKENKYMACLRALCSTSYDVVRHLRRVGALMFTAPQQKSLTAPQEKGKLLVKLEEELKINRERAQALWLVVRLERFEVRQRSDGRCARRKVSAHMMTANAAQEKRQAAAHGPERAAVAAAQQALQLLQRRCEDAEHKARKLAEQRARLEEDSRGKSRLSSSSCMDVVQQAAAAAAAKELRECIAVCAALEGQLAQAARWLQ